MSKTIVFRLEDEMWERVKSHSGLTGRSVSQYIRDILEVNYHPFLLKNKNIGEETEAQTYSRRREENG